MRLLKSIALRIDCVLLRDRTVSGVRTSADHVETEHWGLGVKLGLGLNYGLFYCPIGRRAGFIYDFPNLKLKQA